MTCKRGMSTSLILMCGSSSFFFFSSRRRHTRFDCDWSSDVCSSDLTVVEVDHPKRGKYLTVGNPIKLSDSPCDVKHAPLLGEHNDEVLTKVLGYSKKEVAEIKASGAMSATEK